MPAYTIYISSTYRDLVAEREGVILALRRAQYRVVSMEAYPPASSDNIRDICQRDVRNSHIYIGIIGDNYGSLALGPNGEELPLSYTEYEYEAAVVTDSKRLIFFKQTNQPVQDPRLQRFIARIRSESGAQHGAFKRIEDLPALVLAAIVAETDEYVQRNISPNERYYCDRIPQMARLHELNKRIVSDPVRLFLLTGYPNNSHESLVKRYKLDFLLKQGKIEPWEVNFNIGDLYKENAQTFVSQMRSQLDFVLSTQFDIQLPALTAEALLNAMSAAGCQTCIINLILQTTSLQNRHFMEICKKGLQTFFTGFSANIAPDFPGSKIIFFLQFHYSAGERPEVHSAVEKWPFVRERAIVLTNVRNDDINFWLRDRKIEENAYLRDSLVLAYFEPLNAEKRVDPDMEEGYFMARAQLEMQKIIDLYNNRKKTS